MNEMKNIQFALIACGFGFIIAALMWPEQFKENTIAVLVIILINMLFEKFNDDEKTS